MWEDVEGINKVHLAFQLYLVRIRLLLRRTFRQLASLQQSKIDVGLSNLNHRLLRFLQHPRGNIKAMNFGDQGRHLGSYPT